MDKLKKILANKNTLTILLVFVGIVILWYFYNLKVNQSIQTLNVPYASEKMDASSAIVADKVKYKSVTKATIQNSDLITNMGALQNMYVCPKTSIPANGFFYKSQLCEFDKRLEDLRDGLPKGYTIYTLGVDSSTTYANSIQPGDYIDLYLTGKTDRSEVLYNPLLLSIRVRAVRDNQDRDVFWNSKAGAPTRLLFEVSENQQRLLRVIELVQGNSLKVIPVPRNKAYTETPGNTKLANNGLCDFISSKYSPNSSEGIDLCSEE